MARSSRDTITAPFSEAELTEPREAGRIARRKLAEQLRYVRSASAFYRRKLGDGPELSPEDLPGLPFTTKEELRKAQLADPPFGEVRAAPPTRIVRLHVTREIGARAYFAAGVRPDDIVLHCMNYALYVGGLADHLSIERTGATMVPVGVGQTGRILDLWDQLSPTTIFCTPSYARHLADAAQARGREPATLGLRLLVVGGEAGVTSRRPAERLRTRGEHRSVTPMGWARCGPRSPGSARLATG